MLCSAAHEGWEAGLRELISVMGLSPDLGDYDGRTAMHLAASAGHLAVLRFLVEEAGGGGIAKVAALVGPYSSGHTTGSSGCT